MHEIKKKYMIKFSIRGLGTGELSLLDHKKITHIVSIGGEGDAYPDLRPYTNLKAMIRLEFDDVEDDKPTLVNQIVDSGFSFAKFNDIRRLIIFARGFTKEEKDNAHVLFHCHAGISRSTAAAIIFLMSNFQEYNRDDVWNAVLAERPQAKPNIWMVKLADKLLLEHGSLASFVARKLNISNYDVHSVPTITKA